MFRYVLRRASLRQVWCRPQLGHLQAKNALSPPFRLFTVPATSRSRPFSSGIVQDDTIYALSSGHGKAGIAVIRVSGPASLEVSPSHASS